MGNTESFDRFNSRNRGLKLTAVLQPADSNILTIEVEGSLDTENAGDFGAAVTEALKAQPHLKTVIFNLQGLIYIASTGIGVLTTLLIQCREQNIHLVLLKITQKIRTVLEMLGFLSSFHIIDDLSELPDRSVENGAFGLVACPSCEKSLRIAKAGRYRCPHCKTEFRIDGKGSVHLTAGT